MTCLQRELKLPVKCRGFHLITADVTKALPELESCRAGILQLFLQHTSASLSINENADADVRQDLDMALAKIAPESFPYRHTAEGPDDMPAHVKTALLGVSLTIPVRDGRLALGTWQGIYLGEHRIDATPRTVLISLLT